MYTLIVLPLKTLSYCILRPNLTLHVFGSGGCGKKSLKRQWFDGSHSPVLSEIADIHIRIQVNRSVGDRGVCLFQLCIDHSNLSVYNNRVKHSNTLGRKWVDVF